MNQDFESSLKSLETEIYIDRVFYRPIGYKIAKALSTTSITPNFVTIVSIFIGSGAGLFFYFPYSLISALCGIAFLVMANILDCVDGQLARLTNTKSEIGRILDGFAGDFWFLIIYIAFAYRCNVQFDTWMFTPVAFISAIGHLNQANLVDYYKTLHLFFLSKEKGKEFESSEHVKARVDVMPAGVNRFFSFFYIIYTRNQERQTPKLQQMLNRLRKKHGDDLPQDVRVNFRKFSTKLMTLLNVMTFNGRSIIIIFSVLFNVIWFYFVWELIILGIVNYIVKSRHEKFCSSFEND